MLFHIENMTCGGCVRRVTQAIQALDPAAQVKAEPTTRKVVVSSSRSAGEIEAVLAQAGYPAAPAA